MPTKRAAMNMTDSVVCLTDACNYRCIFCSRRGAKYAHSPAEIKKIIKRFPDDVCLEGGEPMLAKDLEKWITFAKRRGVRDIILVTNGFGLDEPAAVKKLLTLGVTMFNVNFPAHEPKLYGLLTGTRGKFGPAASSVRNLIKTAGPERVRLTLVVNTVVAKYLPDYARFLVKAFPGLFYVEMNMVKVLGAAAGRTWLVPELSALEPRLAEAFAVLERGKVRFITDGFPLCRMKGFEDHSIDTRLLISRGRPATLEKGHAAVCRACTLKKLCPGPRKDYLALHGPAALKPSRKGPAPIIAKTRRLWLSAR